MLAKMVIIFVVVYGLEHASFMQGTSKLKRTLTVFVVLFVALAVLNLIWPYVLTYARKITFRS
jgi:uncharacterized membrane protein YadS